MSIAHSFAPSQVSKLKLERRERKMPYIIVRETDTGVLVEGLSHTEWSQIATQSQVIMSTCQHFFKVLIPNRLTLRSGMRQTWDLYLTQMSTVWLTSWKQEEKQNQTFLCGFLSDKIFENMIFCKADFKKKFINVYSQVSVLSRAQVLDFLSSSGPFIERSLTVMKSVLVPALSSSFSEFAKQAE